MESVQRSRYKDIRIGGGVGVEEKEKEERRSMTDFSPQHTGKRPPMFSGLLWGQRSKK